MFRSVLIVLLLAMPCFGEFTVEQKQITAIMAKSAHVEQIGTDNVAVFIDGQRGGPRSGVCLAIKSDYKFAVPFIDMPGLEVFQSKTNPTKWFMFGPVGKYRVQLVESDPEKGLQFSAISVTIGESKPDPKPEDPKPPTSDLTALVDQSYSLSIKLDPGTRKALAGAYRRAIETSSGKSYFEVRKAVVEGRIGILNSRKGEARKVDWLGGFLNPIDVAVSSLVKDGDVTKYVSVIEAILFGLEK